MSNVLHPQQVAHVRNLGGECEAFSGLIALYHFPEDSKEWQTLLDDEIDRYQKGQRLAIVSWANKVRRERLKAAL